MTHDQTVQILVVLLVFVVGGHFWVRLTTPRRVRRVARTMFDRNREAAEGPLDLLRSDAARFPDLDPPWLDSMAAQARAAGYVHLGDYESPRTVAGHKGLRVVLRAMNAPGGGHALLFDVIRLSRWNERLGSFMAGRPTLVRMWTLASHFDDMSMVVTTTDPNGVFRDTKPGNVLRCLPHTDGWDFGLGIHRAEVEKHLTAVPTRRPVIQRDETEFLAVAARFHEDMAVHRRALGYITPESVRKIARTLPGESAKIYMMVADEIARIHDRERAAGALPPAPAAAVVAAPEGSAP